MREGLAPFQLARPAGPKRGVVAIGLLVKFAGRVGLRCKLGRGWKAAALLKKRLDGGAHSRSTYGGRRGRPAEPFGHTQCWPHSSSLHSPPRRKPGLATIQYDAPPPNFAIATARKTTYLSDLRGRVVVVDFWATWCDVCTAELRDFVRAASVFGKGVAVVTVSDELPGVASSYLEHWDICVAGRGGRAGRNLSHLLRLESSGDAGARPGRCRFVRFRWGPKLARTRPSNRPGPR